LLSDPTQIKFLSNTIPALTSGTQVLNNTNFFKDLHGNGEGDATQPGTETEATSQEEVILTPHELAMPEVLHVQILGNRTGEERKGGERGKTSSLQTLFNMMS